MSCSLTNPGDGRRPRQVRPTVALLALALLAGLLPGCGRPDRVRGAAFDEGLIWIFPGVEGGAWSMEGARRAFRDSGIRAEIRIYEWNRPLGVIRNLLEYKENRENAARIAGQIAIYQETHPDAPIDLVGYSGGGGMAVMVAEALPAEASLRHVILAQPALSPGYDLTPALRRVTGKMVNFYSNNDWFLLGAGTSLVGTMDRKHVMSAGKRGFNLVKAVPDPQLRPRFEQHGWTMEALLTGHVGTHYGILLYTWNRKYVAPYLLGITPRHADPAPDAEPVREDRGEPPAGQVRRERSGSSVARR